MPVVSRIRLKNTGKIAGAWVAIILACYLLLESLLLCCTAYLFPYAARVSFGFGIYPLLQTSKAGAIPKDYIAIFGDSFGFGAGDQFHNTQQEINPQFNVTHRIYKKTGRDFISFAIPGSSNLCGWIEDPIVSMNYINATWFYHIDPPGEILLYFYEGNDISDTHVDLRERYIINGYKKEKMQEPAYFANFIQKEMLEKSQINLKSRSLDFTDNFLLAGYVLNVIEERKNREIAKNYFSKLTLRKPGNVNRVLIKNQETSLPDNMQAPPVDISASELNDTLDFINAIATYVRDRYPLTPISIIYIPSTVTSYQFTSETVSIYNPEAKTLFPLKDILRQSNSLCMAMHQIATSHGFGFSDTRKKFLEHSQRNLIHGPLDWGHLNKEGYDALAEAILEYLQAHDNSSTSRLPEPCITL